MCLQQSKLPKHGILTPNKKMLRAQYRFIQRGWDPHKVLTLQERRHLVKEGILINGSRNDDINLPEEATELLNETYKNKL